MQLFLIMCLRKIEINFKSVINKENKDDKNSNIICKTKSTKINKEKENKDASKRKRKHKNIEQTLNNSEGTNTLP